MAIEYVQTRREKEEIISAEREFLDNHEEIKKCRVRKITEGANSATSSQLLDESEIDTSNKRTRRSPTDGK